ncbi:MAG: hypothetical protein ACLRWF_10340 [Ruthenibacterium sp.]
MKTVERNGSGKLQCGAAEPVAECGVFAGAAASGRDADGMGAPGQLFGGVLDAQFAPHAWSFLFGWLFLVFVYGVLCMAFGRHWPAQLILGVVCFGFGAATYLKLQMRGEPLLPWDFPSLAGILRRGQQGKPVYPVALLCGWGLFCRAAARLAFG